VLVSARSDVSDDEKEMQCVVLLFLHARGSMQDVDYRNVCCGTQVNNVGHTYVFPYFLASDQSTPLLQAPNL
jgi:hypothetical protein